MQELTHHLERWKTADLFNELLDLNLTGYSRFCKYTRPHLRKVQGSIVNMSSLATDDRKKHLFEICAT